MPALRFGIAVVLAVTSVATARVAEIDSGGSDIDLTRLNVAERAAYHGRYSEAIAKASAIIAASPNFAWAYFVRASLYVDAGRYSEALADIVRVEGFHPQAVQAAILRATIELRQRDPQGALKELARAAGLPAFSFWKQTYEGDGNGLQNGYLHLVTQHTVSYELAYASIAYEMLGQDTQALDSLTHALTFETDKPFYVLASHCFYAAVVGLSGMAEVTCDEAIAKQTHDIGDYDSLGMAHLKMKAWSKAIDDYNHALYTKPDLTVSLYGRGIAKRASGDLAGGDSDIAAAKRDEPDIVNIMAQMGIVAG